LNAEIDFKRIINESNLKLKVDQLSQKLKVENRKIIRIASVFRVNENNEIIIAGIRARIKDYKSIAEELILGFSEEEVKLIPKKKPISILIRIELGDYQKRIKKQLKKE